MGFSVHAAKQILEAAGQDSTFLSRRTNGDLKQCHLTVKLTTSMQVKATYNKSHNVIAKIPGTKTRMNT